jgi:hypothetical protein
MVTQHNGKLGYQLVSLAISNLAPLIMYFALSSHVASDTEALALAWFIPVVWTLGSSLWLRRLDGFGLLGVVAYGIALSISVFFGAGALPLKLHHAVVAGVVGLMCLVSLAMGKPFFLLFTRRSAKHTEYATQIEAALADPPVAKRLSNLTLIIGIACLADAALQTALALVLSTSAFLIARTAIHVSAVMGIVLGLFVLFWVKSNR